MKKIGLTSEEEEELERRGFVIKLSFEWKRYIFVILKLHTYIGIFLIIAIFGYIGISGILYGIVGVNNGINPENDTIKYILPPLIGLFFIIPVFNTVSRLLSFGKVYVYLKGKTIQYIDSDEENETSKIGSGIFSPLFIENIISNLANNNDRDSGKALFGGFIWGLIPFISYPKEYCLFLMFFGIFIYSGRFIFQYFNPLYAFGNLGEKIQKLTPDIESQSKLIQSEFEKDQNLGVLHSGFEKLSTIFSNIVELVLKLEKVEKKANKGNLFDSVKYINSLRTDIVAPLVELRKFLEGQKEALLQSQKELTRVIVGESSEITGNRELATKRGEGVLSELDNNIEKLEEMIEKMR